MGGSEHKSRGGGEERRVSMDGWEMEGERRGEEEKG
jgi:hypothetical protein